MKNDSDIDTGVIYCVASLSSFSKFCMWSRNGQYENWRDPNTTTSSFRSWTPETVTNKPTYTYLSQEQASGRFQSKPQQLGLHMAGWKFSVHPDTPLWLWLGAPYVVGCTENQVLGGSPIQVLFRLSRLNIGVPNRSGLRPWSLSHPSSLTESGSEGYIHKGPRVHHLCQAFVCRQIRVYPACVIHYVPVCILL